MEKIPEAGDLGPRPSVPRRTPLSRACAAVLAAVGTASRETAGPVSLARLTDITGLHANTIRGHLDALVADGLVRREPAAPSGRGRPAWLYEVVEDSHVAEYAGLAATLAAVIHRTSPHPVEDAVDAGAEWGHDLARAAGAPAEAGDAGARRQVISVLDRMGFGSRVDTASGAEGMTVHLTRCPLLDAARRYPDVVCGVHLGIAKGALQEYGADDSATRLNAFAEPGACVLHLGPEGTAR